MNTTKRSNNTTPDLSAIMRRAWQIRRETAQQHGVEVKEVLMFACMQQAWKEAKRKSQRKSSHYYHNRESFLEKCKKVLQEGTTFAFSFGMDEYAICNKNGKLVCYSDREIPAVYESPSSAWFNDFQYIGHSP